MTAQQGIGRKIQFGLAKETTRGTAVASASYWNPWMDLVLDEKKELVPDDQAYGVIEDNIGFTQTKKWAEGSLSGIVSDQTIGLVLYSVFGGYAVTGPSDSAYTHAFTVGQSAQHQSLTFFKHDPLAAQDYSYANGVVQKLEITLAVKKFVEYQATISALSGAAKSDFTPATTAENRFVPQYATASFALSYAGLQGTLTATGTAATTIHVTGLSISTSVLKIGMGVSGVNVPAGATVAAIISDSAFDLSAATSGAVGTMTFTPVAIPIKSLKLTIDQNTEPYDVLGSVGPADYLNKEFSVEGTFEAIFKNESDFKTQFMGPTPLSMRFDLVNSDVTIGAGTHPEIKIDLPKVTILELGIPYKVKDLVYQTVKFKASYSTADTMLAKVSLVNTVTTY